MRANPVADFLSLPYGVVRGPPAAHSESIKQSQWEAATSLFLTGGAGTLMCKTMGMSLGAPPFSPEIVSLAAAKIYTSAGTAKLNMPHTYYKTNERRRKSSPISSLKAKIRISHAALEKNGPSPILTAKINTLHNELEQARATFSHQHKRPKTTQQKRSSSLNNSFPHSNPEQTTETSQTYTAPNHGSPPNMTRTSQPKMTELYHGSCANTTLGYTARNRR
jgi:hypothetical protein